jgi:hypothetical protein
MTTDRSLRARLRAGEQLVGTFSTSVRLAAEVCGPPGSTGCSSTSSTRIRGVPLLISGTHQAAFAA